MKKFWLVFFIILLIIVCVACAASPVDQYANFIDDLDLFTRMQTAIGQVEEGGMSLYVKADMKTLQKDLQLLRSNDSDILEIHAYFLNAVQALRDWTVYEEANEAEKAQAAYQEAKEQFDAGFLKYTELGEDGGASGGR